ncbi:MAG: hypothetical protein FWC80_00490 [Firmicutes bacterium]|nr:hypothetical protein [Bacillota bacterium]
MITISFQLTNGYVGKWHEVRESSSATFEHVIVLKNIEGGKTAEEQLAHFNNNYLNYILRDGRLYFDKSHNGFEKERQKQAVLMSQTKRISELRRELTAYSEDAIQLQMGINIPDIEERKARFRAVHAELRQLEGKPPRG